MAIRLQSKTNVIAPAAPYPYGRIKDNPGDGSGTPVNEQVYGDFHQFFAKLLDDAGITGNDLPENSTNTFQYILALNAVIKNIVSDSSVSYITTGITFQNSAAGGTNLGMKKTSRNTIKMRGMVDTPNPFQNNVLYMTLPVGYRPSVEKNCFCSVYQDTASPFLAFCNIKTNGEIRFFSDYGGSVAFTGHVCFDSVEFDL